MAPQKARLVECDDARRVGVVRHVATGLQVHEGNAAPRLAIDDVDAKGERRGASCGTSENGKYKEEGEEDGTPKVGRSGGVWHYEREQKRSGGQRSREEKMEGREAEKRRWADEAARRSPVASAEKQVFEKVKKEPPGR